MKRNDVRKSLEEKKERAWQDFHILPQLGSFGNPTYCFEKGDVICVGHLQNCVVDERKVENGLVLYGFTYENKNGEIEYMYMPWYNARPLSKEIKTNFTQEDNIDIRFTNTSLESLLSKFYLHGINMNPDYQRDYVWEDTDKEALLDSIFNHIEIGKFAFIHKGYTEEMTYEILDGKQRLSTLLDFYENRLPYKGVYFNDLSPKDRYTFLETPVTVGETGELTKEQIYKYFYTLNRCGKVMDEEHLEKIKEMLKEENPLEEETER